MRYLSILATWLLAWYLPRMAGDWYDLHFQLYQALISLGLMLAVIRLTDEWWKAEYLTLCVLQILHNLGDFLFLFPPENYNYIQATLNWLELAVILGAGGITQLYRMAYGRGAAGRNRDRGSDGAARRAPSGRRHA